MEKKQLNKSRIVKFIRDKKQTPKSEIASVLGISMPTVLQNVKELLDENIISEVGEYQSTGGRKAKALSIKSDKKNAIGIDLTANHISYVAIDLVGTIIGKKRIRKEYENSIAYYDFLNQNLNQFILENKLKKNKILGVGISIPGIIDSENDLLLRSHILQVSNISLKMIRQLITYEVHFENDANSAALAELKGRDQDAIYLSLSNSVGGSICLNGSIYGGKHFKSAEFGHMIVEKDGASCYCGKKGCLDAYCSAWVLSRHTNEDLKVFFEQLDQKVMNLAEVWDRYLEYLAIGVTNLRMIFDCDIILGGYVGSYLKNYMLDLYEKLGIYNQFDSDDFYVIPCNYDQEVAAVGVAMTFADQYFETLN